MNLLLLLVFLVVSAFKGLVLAQPHRDPGHLCTKITTGRFDRIKFKSMTYYEGSLLIFESDRKYYIAKEHLAYNKFQIPISNYSNWYEREMELAIKGMRLTSKMRSVYILDVSLNWNALNIDKFKPALKIRIGLNVVTLDQEYMWTIFFSRPYYQIKQLKLLQPSEIWHHNYRLHPDYSIVHDTNRSGARGFVIHRDIYNHRAPFIVYDLSGVSYSFPLNIHTFKATPEQRAAAHYYYLEKTEQPDEVVLVHRSNIDVARPDDTYTRRPGDLRERSLFTQLPVGYRYEGTVYLFEPEIGCVYAINEFGQLGDSLQAGTKDQYRKRTNIPYEKFFRCDPAFYPMLPKVNRRHPTNRCETRYVRVMPYPTLPEDPLFTQPVILASLLLLGVLTVITVLLGWWWYKCLKRKKVVAAEKTSGATKTAEPASPKSKLKKKLKAKSSKKLAKKKSAPSSSKGFDTTEPDLAKLSRDSSRKMTTSLSTEKASKGQAVKRTKTPKKTKTPAYTMSNIL